ncbi:hypothetical protein GCM10023216_30360 [Isoptericola chiayiensis]|uniref:N-acetyltransferase domain-containing protein n=1 Tax=Isoptericola chiayiensis TaxID=579446 RepID=A0ABP8YQH9_9MICO|nr:hypothetical protein [Isoptericola chiayiensis]NOW01808.1 hypothetical protein [Isoptericola chiayiensis]
MRVVDPTAQDVDAVELLLADDGGYSRRVLGRAPRRHDAVERVARWPEISRLRLAVVDTNRDVAAPFWRALGYEPTGDVTPFESGSVRSTARIWARPAARR